jgi:FKBP-type peptidyl-prolyl cis-trans isomerase (trigger factor)
MTKKSQPVAPTAPFTQSPDGTVTFDLTIPAAVVTREYTHVVDEYVKTAEIKGFRKGKAPRSLVESNLDQTKVINHVLDHALPPVYSTFLTTHKLSPLVDPRMAPKAMEMGSDWVFTVTTACAPQVELGDYKSAVKKALVAHRKTHAKEAKTEEGKAKDPSHEEERETSAIFDALLKSATVELSELLVDAETKSALSRLVNQLASLKIKVEDYAKSIKKSVDELVKEYQETAKTNLKLEFVLQKLIEIEAPEVTDDEISELKPGKGQEAYAKYVLQKRKVLDLLKKL